MTTSKSPRPDVNDDQRAVLEEILAVFLCFADWPTHLYLEQQLEAHGIELNEVLEAMPQTLFAPDNRTMGGGVFYQDDDKLSLRIRGLSVCRDAETQQGAFMAALRWAVQARQALQVPPNEAVQPQWPLSEAVNAMETELERSIPPNDIKFVFELMRSETGLPTWGGQPEDITTWKVSIPSTVRRFRSVETLDDYLELSKPPPTRSFGQPSDEIAQEEPEDDIEMCGLAFVDSALSGHVRVLFEAREWSQLATQTVVYVEDTVRRWAELPNDCVGEKLWTAVLSPESGRLRLGKIKSEMQGWHRLGMGFSLALRNVNTHHIQDRPDVAAYAFAWWGRRVCCSPS